MKALPFLITGIFILLLSCKEPKKEEVCIKAYFIDGHARVLCYDLPVNSRVFINYNACLMYEPETGMFRSMEVLRRGNIVDYEVISRKEIK